jgi:hypothetical protein
MRHKQTISPGDGNSRHGQNGYSNYGCRCDICKTANTNSHYEYIKRHPEQQKKSRDRQRISKGLDGEKLAKLEEEYQQGMHRGGKTRVE